MKQLMMILALMSYRQSYNMDVIENNSMNNSVIDCQQHVGRLTKSLVYLFDDG